MEAQVVPHGSVVGPGQSRAGARAELNIPGDSTLGVLSEGGLGVLA